VVSVEEGQEKFNSAAGNSLANKTNLDRLLTRLVNQRIYAVEITSRAKCHLSRLSAFTLFFGVTSLTISPHSSAAEFLSTWQWFGNSLASVDVALGDIDSDGDVDVIIANSDNAGSSVWLNDGYGHFRHSGQFTHNPSPDESALLVDLDSDGDLDIFHAGSDEVWLNDGSGFFELTQTFDSVNGSDSGAVADIDGDGDRDIWLSSFNADTDQIWLNDGSGSFSNSGVNLNYSSEAVFFGDFDGDDDLDAWTIGKGANHDNQIWLNNGDGDFSQHNASFGPVSSSFVAFGDVDSDGDLDAWVADDGHLHEYNRLWLNDGAGNFSDSGQALGSGTYTSVSLADIDSDGDLDAWVTGGADGLGNSVWLNDGAGRFTDSAQALGDSSSQSVALADMDGDGDLDAVVATGWYGIANQLWLNNGFGSFTSAEHSIGFSQQSSNSVELGDVDRDGDLDAIVCDSYRARQSSHIWLNRGDGIFSNSGLTLDGGGAYGTSRIGDLDGDGDLDIWSTNKVYLNDGTGRYSDSGQTFSSYYEGETALGDLDGDGDLDAISREMIWFNDGRGLFSAGSETIGSANYYEIELGDLDGDRDLDILISNHDGSSIWLNDGSGKFTQFGFMQDGRQYSSMALGDLDGDGDLDVWAGLEGNGSIVLLNNGNATFTDSGQLLNALYISDIQLTDFDKDGDLDVVAVTNHDLISNRLWINDGKANFVPGQELGNSNDSSVAAGDLNGDGLPDIWIAGSMDKTSRVWLQREVDVIEEPNENGGGGFVDLFTLFILVLGFLFPGVYLKD
jgi:hypothetical protein